MKRRDKRQHMWTLDQLLDGVEYYLNTAERYVQHVLDKKSPNEEHNAKRWLELVDTQLGFIYKLILDRSVEPMDIRGTRLMEMRKRVTRLTDNFDDDNKED